MSKVPLQSTTVAHDLSLQDNVLLSISKLALFEQQTAQAESGFLPAIVILMHEQV